MNDNDPRNDPRFSNLMSYVTDLMNLRKKYGLSCKEIHVNPLDEYLNKFGTIAGMKVVKDYNVSVKDLVIQ